MILMEGISGSGAAIVQMVVHSTCLAQSQVSKYLRFWAIAVVLTFLNRTIILLKPAENKAIFPFDAPRVEMLKGLSRLAASDFTIGEG